MSSRDVNEASLSGLSSTQQKLVINTGKYRAYSTAVEKSLKLFESSNDWTDLISALGKLGKALCSNAKSFNEIPYSAVVSKRLSQCLHPALEPSVHIKALETYRHVFTILGSDNLAKQVHLFTTGLFPLMDHCQIKVKYELLGIFEQFLLPLESNIHPVLPGLIAAILHGLESGAEYYEKSLNLLEKVSIKAGPEAFYSAFWQANGGNPSIRLPALLFVNLKFEKRKASLNSLVNLITGHGSAVRHMVDALCIISEDPDPSLIQRHLLDFLCTVLPLDSENLIVTRDDLVEILRRSLFIVLRRDTSLNKRLYQWLLNRPSDAAAIPLSGSSEELAELKFFKQHALKLIKTSIHNSLLLDVIDVPNPSSVTLKYNMLKESHQQQFSEVRVCKLLHYLFTDRQELKMLVLHETLIEFLESAYLRNKISVKDFDEECEFLSCDFHDIQILATEGDTKQAIRRFDEVKNNFNALLNSLDPDYLWVSLGNFFTQLTARREIYGCSFERFSSTKNHLDLFPSVIAFCLETVQLDSHGDIRGFYIPNLLIKIMSQIATMGCENFSRENVVSLLIVSRKMLSTINLSAEISTFFGGNETNDFNGIIEMVVKSCCQLVNTVCKWYLDGRCLDKIGSIYALSSLIRDLSDLPFLSDSGVGDTCILSNISSNIQLFDDKLLMAFADVIDPFSWNNDSPDFDVRVCLLDLVLYLYIRSITINEKTMLTNNNNQFLASNSLVSSNGVCSLVSSASMNMLNNISIKESTKVLWNALVGISDPKRMESVSLLLLRIHSRHVKDPSSEVEDVIIENFTARVDCVSGSKTVGGQAILNFYNFWSFCRNFEVKEIFNKIPIKPFNRVIMVLLNFATDEKIASENIELRSLSNYFLTDCANHHDLHKILQTLTMMLLNPSTARVSIQFVSIKSRITNAEIPSMPSELNCITLATLNQQQKFYHICTDIDADVSTKFDPENPCRNSRYVDCSSENSWVSDLNVCLLSPPINAEFHYSKSCAKKDSSHKVFNCEEIAGDVQVTRRLKPLTASDIPQFDDDECDSISSISLNSSFEHEICDVVQFIVDTVCSETEVQDAIELIYSDNKQLALENEAKQPVDLKIANLETNFRDSQNFKENCLVNRNNLPPDGDEVSVIGSLNAFTSHTQSLPRADTIKRVRSGHRRQDSLQESIFSSGTKELKFFELPTNTCPGDSKQPLLDETMSHMLIYTENPSIVDLARSKQLLNTFHALMKRDHAFRRALVTSLIFTKSSSVDNREETFQNTLSPLLSLPAVSRDLIDLLGQHYRHIQGDGFWTQTNIKDESDSNDNMLQRKLSVLSTSSPQSQLQPQTEKNKQQTLFEVFSTVVLYYLRSYYLNSSTQYVSDCDLLLSWKCKIAALDCYAELLRALNDLLTNINSQEFISYIQLLYRQTKAQKVILSLLLAMMPSRRENKDWRMPLAVDIAEFNSGVYRHSHFKDLFTVYQHSLLSVTSVMVILEYNLNVGCQNASDSEALNFFQLQYGLVENQISYNIPQNRSTIKDPRYSVVELKMFLSVVVNALRQCSEQCEIWLQFVIGLLQYLDRALATFVVHSVEQITRNIYQSVSFDIDIDILNTVMVEESSGPNVSNTPSNSFNFIDEIFNFNFTDYRIILNNDYNIVRYPANCTLIMLDALRSILHFCMLDQQKDSSLLNKGLYYYHHSQTQIDSSPLSVNQQLQSTSISNTASNMTSMVGSAIMALPGTGLLNNLFGRFTSSDTQTPNSSRSETHSMGKLEAHNELVKRFPSVLAILCDVWRILKKNDSVKSYRPSIMSLNDALCTKILQSLEPIAKKHQSVIINSFGIVWIARRDSSTVNFATSSNLENYSQLFEYSLRHALIVDLMLKIDVISLTAIILTVNETLKESRTRIANDKANISLDIALLEILHQCIREVSTSDLKNSWGALNTLFFESPLGQLPARANFLAFMMLVNFTRRCGSLIFDDKNISKTILEVCQRLIEAMNSIVGWQLESVNWLKRTLVVKQDVSPGQRASDYFEQRGVSAISSEAVSMRSSTISLYGGLNKLSLDGSSTQSNADLKKSSSNLRSSLKDGVKKDPSCSTQALFLLAENLVELVDSTSKSEDKEKLLPTIQSVWNNTLPYLKEKGTKNVRCFLAGSQLLASLSSYNYMRSVWKKNVIELMWDSGFFKMDIRALKHWLITIDNLMTNDKTSFKELLTRITTSTSTALSTLMTSREAEYEIRSQHVKRLAFVIFSSEIGQYSEQLSEVLERLNENLRINQVPLIHAQVFICYRILLIRMMPNTFETIWPSLYTEMVQVLTLLEHQINLLPVVIEDQKTSKDDYWMQLFLATCKLLETLCTLPLGHVVQFQLCRWVFVPTFNNKSQNDLFVPFSARIRQALVSKFEEIPVSEREIRTASLFNIKTLTSFRELLPFFQALSEQNKLDYIQSSNNGSDDVHQTALFNNSLSKMNCFRDEEFLTGTLSLKAASARIDHSILIDMADHWQL